MCTREFPGIDGVGAELYGGRWNSPGRPVVYTSSCGALATLEYLAHVTRFPKNMWIVKIEVPDTLDFEMVNSFPADPAAFRQLGDEWLVANKSPVLGVPSVLVPSQWNYLLNPKHPMFGAIKLIQENPFVYDPRLLSNIPV